MYYFWIQQLLCFRTKHSILQTFECEVFCCLSAGYSHCTCMHLNICAILFWMFDRKIIQQVPQLSKHAICDASTSSTDSSNYTAPRGNLHWELLPQMFQSIHRTLTLFNIRSPISAKLGSVDNLLLIFHLGWQWYDWYCSLASRWALKYCLIFDMSLISVLLVSYLFHVLIIPLFNGDLSRRSSMYGCTFFPFGIKKYWGVEMERIDEKWYKISF